MTTPVSVIICTRNRPNLLEETVRSILEGDKLPDELVVVDGSDRPHPRLAGHTDTSPIRYLWSPSKGLGRARNRGVAAARHPVLVFADDDMLAAPDWLRVLVSTLVAEGEGAVVTGQVPPIADVPGGRAPSTKVDAQQAIYAGRISRDILFAGNMALYRSALARVGLFDERLGAGAPFPSAEDNDFGYRLLEAGYRVIYQPRAVLYHRAWRDGRESGRVAWRYGIGQGAFYCKHLGAPDIRRRVRTDLLYYARRTLRSVPSDRAWEAAAFELGMLYGMGKWWLTQGR